MKKQVILGIIGIVAGVIVTLVLHSNDLSEKYKTAMANIKQYDLQLSNIKDKNTAYQLTVDQLNTFKDSVVMELNKARKELGIKDKNLKSLQVVSSSFSKTDTLILSTPSPAVSVSIDTLMGDNWYSLKLGLHSDTLTVKPSFNSRKDIVVSTKKEIIGIPKKWWFLRIFQKKHTVLQVDVVEQSPYIVNGNSRYIEIIND